MTELHVLMGLLAVVEIAGLAIGWLWLRARLRRLAADHEALHADHGGIGRMQQLPTRDATTIARLDMEVGDVVRELHDLHRLVEMLAQREALTARRCQSEPGECP